MQLDAKATGYACPRCTVGRCTPQHATFCDMIGDQLLSIPNTRAHICDVCHFVEFDQELLDGLWERLYGEAPREDFLPTMPQKRSPTFGEG